MQDHHLQKKSASIRQHRSFVRFFDTLDSLHGLQAGGRIAAGVLLSGWFIAGIIIHAIIKPAMVAGPAISRLKRIQSPFVTWACSC